MNARFLSAFVFAMAATVADAHASPETTAERATETTTEAAPAAVDEDAARYAERERVADEQLAYRGSQGAQYNQAAGIAAVVGGLVVVLLVVVVVIIVI